MIYKAHSISTPTRTIKTCPFYDCATRVNTFFL
nr:MAG TPA: hypothetical protein [Bacteriophage sp.]